MSRIRVDRLTNKSGTGAPLFTDGVNVVGLTSLANVVAGIATATTFSGSLSGNATSATNAQGLTGSPSITVANITATGNVSIGGTLTYEDVTNVDSVGIVTAGGGLTTRKAVVEEGNYNTTALNGEFNFDLDQGHLYFSNANAAASYYANFRISSSVTLNSYMAVGDVVSTTIIAGSNNTSYYYLNTTHIDGNAHGENSYSIVTRWVGGSAPSDGNGSGNDVYSFTITKIADKSFIVFGNANAAA